MTNFWDEIPAGRVVRLLGADAEAIATFLEPMPEDAPAVLTYYPDTSTAAHNVVDSMLTELGDVAVDFFPSWLPGAAGVSGPNGLGIAAVRAVAKEVAGSSDHFGPFLAELAECGLRQSATGLARFPRQTQAAGLIRVIKASYGRDQVAVLVRVPDGCRAAYQRSLVTASEWMAEHSGASMWLAGLSEAHERIRSIVVQVPGHLADPAESGISEILKAPPGPVVRYPPLLGRPHPGSPAEQKLEGALAKRAWAIGRVWNQNFSPHPLVNPVRLDLWWRDERCVVEIDGPEHRNKWRFAEDRRRDVMLHADGLTVLRFTNAQVLDDIDAVLSMIEQFIQTRRSKQGALSSHA